ncbi:alpha/beta hydrolase [Pirellulaceae bacterium SH449]
MATTYAIGLLQVALIGFSAMTWPVVSFGQSAAYNASKYKFVGPKTVHWNVSHTKFASQPPSHTVKAQGAYAVTEIRSLPQLLPQLVDALQATDRATRFAAARALSNVALKIQRNVYFRNPNPSWSILEPEFERALALTALQPNMARCQQDVERLMARMNSGTLEQWTNVRTSRPLNVEQSQFLDELRLTESIPTPVLIHRFENGIRNFTPVQRREILEQLCEQWPPSLIEIILLSSDRYDDDFLEVLLKLAEEEDNPTWELLIASCCPQSKETRQRLTESFLRSGNQFSRKSEVLISFSRAKYVEPEFARRIILDTQKRIANSIGPEASSFLSSVEEFLLRHTASIPPKQLDELKRLAVAKLLQADNDHEHRSAMLRLLAIGFPRDLMVADVVAQLLQDNRSDDSLRFDTIAAISTNENLARRTKLFLLKNATSDEPSMREMALQGLAHVKDLDSDAISRLMAIAFDEPQNSRAKYDDSTKVLAAKAIAAQGAAALEPLHVFLRKEWNRGPEPGSLLTVFRTIEKCGEQHREIDGLLSQATKAPFLSLDERLAAWHARAVTSQMNDRVMKEIFYYLNDWEHESEARAAALGALARICGACSLAKLSAFAHDEDPLIRVTARFAHHYAGESNVAMRLLFDELQSLSENDEWDEETKVQIEESLQDLIFELASNANESLRQILASENYTAKQKVVAFQALASSTERSWRDLLSTIVWNDDNLDSEAGDQFAMAIRRAWNFDTELVPALYAKILDLNPESRIASDLWQIAEDTTLGLGAGDDGDLWGDGALRVAIGRYADSSALVTRSQRRTTSEFSSEQPMAADASLRSVTESLAAKLTEANPSAEESTGSMNTDSQLARAPIGPFYRIKELQSAPMQMMALNQNGKSSKVEPVTPQENNRVVNVFYGTNRQARSLPNLGGALRWGAFAISLVCFLVFVVKFARQKSMKFAIIALLGLLGLTSMARDSLDISYWLPSRNALYTGEYSSEIKYGVCEVSIPPIHVPGELESPSLWMKWEVVEDPDKHIVLKSTQPLPRDEFFDKLRDTLDTKGKSLLVFVHGYNVSFEDAARRTAQMAYDLKFPGAPVFYSWPSYNNWYRYPDDKINIERSVDQIKDFLQQIAIDSKAESINLIAHSMGNVGLTQALAKMGVERPIFNQVVLAAPDIDSRVFREDIAPRITSKANRITLYTSKNDLALVASRFFNSGSRLGDSRDGPVAVPGIDTIDATDIDTSLLGHSYYGSNASVLDDISSLLLGKPLSERSYLRMQSNVTPPYWTFDPSWRTAQTELLNTTPVQR